MGLREIARELNEKGVPTTRVVSGMPGLSNIY